jgi:hypothetical protein
MAKRNVSDRMMDFSHKINVHPYNVTPQHVLDATASGELSAEDCAQFMDELSAAFGGASVN